MTDTSEHALLNASAAVGWSTCGVYLRLNADAPRTSSKAADKGTVQHEVAAWCLQNDAMPDQYPNPAVEVNGVQWPITQEMRNKVADYIAVVRERAKGGTLMVEQRVDYSFWLFGKDPPRVMVRDPRTGERVESSWVAGGTADAPILFDEEIEVIDAKFGENPNNIVFAYEKTVGPDGEEKLAPNPQLALYALGCLYEFEHLGNFRKVRLTIVQPYLDHVSTYEMDVTDLKTFALKMKAAAHVALRHYEAEYDPPLEAYAPSDKACQWCKGAHGCPALAANVATEERDLFGALVEHGGEAMAAAVPEDRLGAAMAKVPLIETFTKAIRAEVERRLLAGHPVPGFKLIEGRRGPRSWRDEAAEKAARGVLVRKLGTKDAMQPAELISPTEAEKRLKRVDDKTYAKLLAKHVQRSDGKPSVAPESDPAPAISITSVEDRFAQVAVQKMLEASVADDLV